MRTLPVRRALRLAALVALTVGLVTAYVFARAYNGDAATTDPWYEPLFVPATVGFMLVGGVHGDAPGWLIVAASSAANGLAWGVVAFVFAYAALEGGRRRAGSQG